MSDRVGLRNLYYRAYRAVMRLAHRFHWHHAPPCYPHGDIVYWCRWCGMRDVMGRGGKPWGQMPPPDKGQGL